MIRVYTTEVCPKCKILKSRLIDARVAFEEVKDLEDIINEGFKSVPVLKVENEYLDFGKAVKWIKDM